MGNWKPARAMAVGLTLGLSFPGAGRAQTELLFETPHLETVAPGTTLVYAVSATRADPETNVPTTMEGAVRLSATAAADPAARTIEVALNRDGRSRTLEPFRGVTGNPILVIFLEQITQDLARAAGGNPRFLRNRIRAGLAGGLTETTEGSTTRLTMQPLKDDPQSAAMGPYANLEVSFTIDANTPGMFQNLIATAGPADAPVFVEEVSYDPQE